MSDFDVKEKRFEEDIEDYLTHHGGYTKGDPKKFNRESGLEEDTFVEFIKTSQPKKWERYVKIYAENSEKQIIERFKREVKTTNLLNVMRHGFMDRGIKFYPIFWKPETSLNETTQMQYDANILHCTRQLHYSVHNENSIDIVLFANGIPVVSMELKCQFTGQDTTNAINQYKFDRAGKDAIFAFKERVLVHFAVDLTNVYMTTRLEGAHTYFLPFNQGSNGAGKVGGKGNPVNPNGYDTAYLWERVLCKDSLMEILQKYMHLQQEYDKNGNLVKETMIFPRYHQLDVVTKLLEDVKKNGSGKSYLIQHSAGSGKSNSIAWLAHRLTGLHDYVSTDSEEQASSYEIQIEHYTNYIKKNKEWELAGIFADDGITGTNTKKREEFNRMIEECMSGKIDMIITKSISRFARNTLDCLKYIRQLKDKNIAVFFEKENINTMDSKGEIMLTIMASLAQQESQSLSQNVKLGIQYRYQQGEVQVNHKRFLGYTKDENKQLVIDPEGAEVVKRIYREYLEGASLLQISRGLEADGILTAAGKAKWRPETLKKILQNEKYIGDALLQKTYTVDFLSKKRVKNNGIVPQYYVENSHEPIIPRELFMQVQEEMVRRANLRGRKGGKKRVYSSKYALSSIVYCGHCGDIYRRVHWNNRGYKSIVWRCVSRLEEKGSECTAPTINEETLQTAVVKAINELLANKEPFLSTLQKNIATVFNEENDNATDDIDGKLEELQQQLLIQAKSKNDYEDVADEIYRLRELKQNALAENAEREGKRQRIAEMTDFLNEQSCELEEYDEQLVRRLIEKVTVFDDKLTVEFKSGVEIDIEI